CGFIKDKDKIYSNLDVLIDPALAQGISNTNLEAMSSNTLLIASKVEGNKDLIIDKVTGLLFSPIKKNNLLNTLIFYKENSKKISQIIDNAKKEISQNYEISVITKRILKFMNSRLSKI
ncbi:MAG: glycosyltransferase, partial [Candidatus Lokiarchaeia archaeon]